MKKITHLHSLFGLLSLGLLIPNGISAAPLSLSDTPLSISTAVKPNVMLLVDNSGSMDNLTWADGYDNTQLYSPAWDYCSSTNSSNQCDGWTRILIDDPWIYFSDFKQTSSCSSGYGRFRNSANTSQTKCLKLPEPVGSGYTRYAGNYLNYLLNTYTNNSVDLTQGQIPTDHRMKVARNVAKIIINDNTNANSTLKMRFGVSRFYGPSSYEYGHGATVDAACNDAAGQATTIIGAICGNDTTNCNSTNSGYLSATNTPLAEALYELTRYFRGLSSYYHGSTGTDCSSNVSCTPYTSPIQYRCQKNFTIVITDGLPTRDTNIPTNDPDDTTGTPNLPNWDELAATTTYAMFPNFPHYSDGFQPDKDSSYEAFTLYLDDIAKFAWDVDFKKTGNDSASQSYQDPKFTKQNMYTYTVGFAVDNNMLEDAAEYGHGEYYTAKNTTDLTNALNKALTDILAKSGSSAAATANAGFIGSDTKVYQARFNSADWSGQLLAFAIDSNTASATYGQPLTNGPGPSGSLWDAGSKIPTSRVIFSIKDDSSTNTGAFVGIPFRWDQLNTTQQSALGNSNVLDYLRGSSALEKKNTGGIYRNRATLLGDIVYSAPVFVGAPNARYPDNLESVAYSTFKNSNGSREKMIYVGANDGMLHGFEAANGVERMAYVPGKLFGNLSALTSPNYSHQYYVDGSPTVIDAFFGASINAWKSVLVGGFNKGGQGIYALDVTSPNNFSAETNAASVVLWEFTDYNPESTTVRSDVDLGYTYGQPAIVRMRPAANGPWVAVFGNGYNSTVADGHASTTGNAVLYIVNLQTGALIKKIDTGVGTAQDPTTTVTSEKRPNGLATVAPADIDGDGIADVIYAGDLFGNLWKFNVSDDSSSNWDVFRVSGTPTPLFSACADNTCTTTNRQPITTRPAVGRHPNGQGTIVYFGTGKFLETTDNNGAAGGKQTFYAIWDNNAQVTGRSVLQQQSITTEGTYTFTAPDSSTVTQQLRVTSNNTVNWGTQKGWYLDLVPPGSTTQGERQITNSILRGGRIIFTTLIPINTDPCNPGGQSWLMELDAQTGSRLSYSPLDLNKDKQFSSGDYVTVSSVPVPVSGQKLQGGAATTPSPMAAEETEMKYISTADGLETVMENPGPIDTGRQTWQQIGQ